MQWALAAVLGLVLASCGSQPAERTATNMPAGAFPPAPDEPATPPPVPVPRLSSPSRPAPSLPTLSPDGLGPLRIGMSRAKVVAAMGEDADLRAPTSPDPARCDQFRPVRAPNGVIAMIEDDRLSRISLIRPSAVRTSRGVGLGSTAAAVRAAYPSAVATPHTYRDAPAAYLTVWSRKAIAGDQASPTDRGIVFEVDERGIVDLVHAGGPSIQYVEGCL